jgi:hypothetical protein
MRFTYIFCYALLVVAPALAVKFTPPDILWLDESEYLNICPRGMGVRFRYPLGDAD